MNILGKFRVLAFLLLFTTTASAATFDLPLSIGQNELGMIPVSLNGMDVEAVSLSQLQQLLGRRVADDIWQALSLNDSLSRDGLIPLNALAQAGVDVQFDSSTLSLLADISADARGLANVDFGEQYDPFIPSDGGTFSWLNSFNFSHSKSWEGNSQDRYSSIEWLAQFNLGGATGANVEAANYLQISDTASQVLRGEWTVFYDNPYAPFRASLGDVESGISGFQSNVSLGGLSIESDYSELQPQRIIGPSNNQELILQESAEVEIIVNGQIIFSGRQEAGRFNLMNLPMSNGANDITVNVTYLSGKTETLVFSQFYNSNLLDEGMFNYAFSLGVPSTFGDNGVEYLDTWAATGFTEYGLYSWLTLGVNGSVAKYGQVVGGLATIRSDWGNISARMSLSNYSEAEADFGSIASLSFESAIIGAPESKTPNLRLSIEFADEYASTPWDNTALPVSYERYLANYVLSINEQWDATLSGSYYLDNYEEDVTGLTSMLNWKNGDITLGAGITYSQDSKQKADDTQYFFSLDWRWNHKQYGYNLGASYNTQENQSRVDISKTNNDRVGSLGFRALAEYEDIRQRQSAQLSYTANRVRLEGEVERSEINSGSSDASYMASVRGNTAFGIAGGKLGWGRSQPGPFVVAQLHPTLSDHEARLGVAQDGSYKAVATSSMGGLLALDMPYSLNNVDLSVPDAPIGYDWGESRVSISPAATTGHVITIGSDASYTAKGVLLSEDGTPISYLQGKLSQDNKHLSFFTNRTGRFFVQGIGPGTYTMTIGHSTYLPLTIVVESHDNRLIDLGTLAVKCVEENCHANQ